MTPAVTVSAQHGNGDHSVYSKDKKSKGVRVKMEKKLFKGDIIICAENLQAIRTIRELTKFIVKSAIS